VAVFGWGCADGRDRAATGGAIGVSGLGVEVSWRLGLGGVWGWVAFGVSWRLGLAGVWDGCTRLGRVFWAVFGLWREGFNTHWSIKSFAIMGSGGDASWGRVNGPRVDPPEAVH
jgi:hypothetical protein